MSEQTDNTPEEINPSPDEPQRRPGDYYYDDATGYEIYDPAKDDENGEEEDEK
jgi:ribosomal 30S subunit maturation factor RimM